MVVNKKLQKALNVYTSIYVEKSMKVYLLSQMVYTLYIYMVEGGLYICT